MTRHEVSPYATVMDDSQLTGLPIVLAGAGPYGGDLEIAAVGTGTRDDNRQARQLAVVHHRGVGTRLMPCHDAPWSDRRWPA